MTLALQDALKQLKNDPNTSVTAVIDGLVVEIRRKTGPTADEVFEAVGSWEGETASEISQLLKESRQEGDSKAPATF